MKITQSRCVVMVLAVAVLTGVLAARGKAEQGTDVDDIMQAKLLASQGLLAALAIEDYEEITRNAQQLSILMLDADWQVLQTEDYIRYSGDFRRAAQAVTEAGRNENLDAAVLGYIELTLTCVACHRYVRDASQDEPASE